MRYLTLREVVELHRAVIERTGGMAGIRDLGLSFTCSPSLTVVSKRRLFGYATAPTVARRWFTTRQKVRTALGLSSKKSSKNPGSLSGAG